MEPAVRIQNLSVMLGGSFKALLDVSVDIPTGKITGILGPSGAGKTTLIRSIVGRQKISSGSIAVFNEPAGSAVLRSQVRYMTQENAVYSDLTVAENLRYFATMSGIQRSKIPEAVARTLQAVSMTDKAHAVVNQLSGGQKQRVSLGVSLLGHPRLLVLDEPTVGLDPLLRDELWKLFRGIAGMGTTIVISSHVMDEAARCDDLMLLRNGQLLAHDSPDRLCKRTDANSVEEAFIRLVEDKR